MASVQRERTPQFNMPRRSQQPGGQLLKNKHCRYAYANIPVQAEPHKDESFSARQAKNPGKSSIYKHGRKRRVSESHEGLHPVARKKRPKSEGELLMTKSVRAGPSSELKSLTEERSLGRLTHQIWDDYLITRQVPQRYEQKLHLRDYLLSIFRTAYPGCSLHICGSTCSGLATNASDIDLCLLLSETREIDQRYEARRILHQLNCMLKRSAYIQKCRVIHAKVPILKFRDSKSGCECDVNINNTVGIKNTHLLQGYCGYDWRVPSLIMIIKKWAKRHRINDASQGTLSSYSLVMMVLHYLQEPCQPPVVPSLQMTYPEIFNGSRNIHDLALENPSIRIARPLKSGNQETLGELLVGFFRYYAEQFRWEKDVISVRQGKKYSKGDSRVWYNKFICIEEPFDLSCVTRAVQKQEKFDSICQRFKIAYYTLTVSPFLESIMSGS